MQPRELLQAAVAFVRQAYLDLPAVAASDAASDHPGKLTSRNQRDDAVMLGLKALRELTNGCPLPAGKPLDLQQQLVLQRRDSLPPGNVLAEPQITAKLVAEPGEDLEVFLGHGMRAHHLLPRQYIT